MYFRALLSGSIKAITGGSTRAIIDSQAHWCGTRANGRVLLNQS